MKAIKVVSIIFIVLGALLFIVGFLFKIMHWPDIFKGYYSGPILFFIGFILLMIFISKNKTE